MVFNAADTEDADDTSVLMPTALRPLALISLTIES